MAKYPDPTSTQIDALQRYAAMHGRKWKSELSKEWQRASYRGFSGVDAGELQRLRNWLGPRWLAQYKLPMSEWPTHPVETETE